MAADMDVVHESMDEATMDGEEYPEGNTFVESNHAVSVEENTRNGRRKNGKNFDSELSDADVQKTHVDQEPSSFVDPDDLEMEEDDITSKLLSIQVLPRIPKRKPVMDDSSSTSVGENSPYYSVLERVNSAAGSEAARYPNWSAAGWSRSNIDRPVRSWNRRSAKDGKAESKPVKRTVSDKLPSRDTKHKTEVTQNKLKRAVEHSAWSVDETDVPSGPSFSEIEQIAADESAAPSLTGPLPTLPFEEQMRERARLRNLKKQGGCDVANNSSDSTEAVLKNFANNDGSKDSFDLAAASNFHTDKAESNQPVVSHREQHAALPGSVKSTLLSHAKSVEHRQLPQHHRSENGYGHGHKVKRPNHQTNRMYAKDKTNQSQFTGVQETTPKSKKESASPPLPYLPVLPLFAKSETQTSGSYLQQVKRISTTSGKKTVTVSLSDQNVSMQNDVHDVSSSVVSKLKPASSATAGTKTVTFSSDATSQDGSKTKRKSKPKVG